MLLDDLWLDFDFAEGGSEEFTAIGKAHFEDQIVHHFFLVVGDGDVEGLHSYLIIRVFVNDCQTLLEVSEDIYSSKGNYGSDDFADK